jgi:hypothetical protein
VIADILKIEDCNLDRHGDMQQLFGLAISAKRYVVYSRSEKKREIIKPSEHGLGIVYVPDKRSRYKPENCKDHKTDYARWIAEAWERILEDHFKNADNPENALVSRKLWFDNLPAMMRVRVTTPNVLKALRKRDPGAAKPYNFAHSPILTQPVPGCTLVAPSSKHPQEWLTREYTEIHTGRTVKLSEKYDGQTLTPQTLSNVLWRHYLHPEDKSLAPNGELCAAYTCGLLQRRPIKALLPFVLIGKEIERKSQEGEEISVLENVGPIQYSQRQTLKTRPCAPALVKRLSQFSLKQLEGSGLTRDTIIRARRGERVHPSTCTNLAEIVQELEGDTLQVLKN